MSRNSRERQSTLSRVFSAARENGPAAAVAVIAFTGSFSHVVMVCHNYGMPGFDAYPVAGVVDLMCVMGAEERQRDKRIGRHRKGWMSWPTIILCLGVTLTLAINESTAQPKAWGYIVAAIAPVALLLAVSLMERRASWPASGAAGSGSRVTAVKPSGKPAAGSQNQGTVVPGTTPEPAAEPVREPVRVAAGERRDDGRKRTEDELVREARTIIAEYAAANNGKRPSWAALGMQLGVAKKTAGDVLRAIDEQDAGQPGDDLAAGSGGTS